MQSDPAATLLLTGPMIAAALILAYAIRAWWLARREWHTFSLGTKGFYLLVTPVLTLAIDILVLSDRLLRPRDAEPETNRAQPGQSPLSRRPVPMAR